MLGSTEHRDRGSVEWTIETHSHKLCKRLDNDLEREREGGKGGREEGGRA